MPRSESKPMKAPSISMPATSSTLHVEPARVQELVDLRRRISTLSSAATQKPPNERETPWLSLARATLA